MDNHFVSIFSIQDLHQKVGEIKHKWESFMTNPTINDHLQTTVRREILNSWDRCQSIGLNPEQQQAKTSLTSYELESLLAESYLYLAAKPIIDHIFDTLIGTGYLITLNDESGKMIYLKGERDSIRKMEKRNFSPGMDWSEAAAGTNAIGTSIISKKPIQVFSAEHYCEGFHSMTCSSSPIFHPYTKNIIGAIDFTGFWQNTQPHTLGLAVSLAKMIENELFTLFQTKYRKLEDYYHTFSLQDQAALVISNDSVLVNGDPTLLNALQLEKKRTFHNHQKIKKLLQNPASFSEQAEGFQLIEMKPIIIHHEEIGYVIIYKNNRGSLSKMPTYLNEHNLIGNSPKIKSILHKSHQIASVNTPILLTGETGTGKELIARYIHEVSSKKDKPFIAINCGAMQKELIGSELFGYESGTFTGGKKEGKKGKFEEANGGTIFLDEIGEMPIDLQVHLLRVLQEKEITRLGSSKTIKIDVKVIAATNQNLEEMIDNGLFRRDLFFRLNVISFTLPSLRERKEDIITICSHYITLFAKKYHKSLSLSLAEETKRFFLIYTWPGNIRELRNALEHAVIFSDRAQIEISHLPDYLTNFQTQHLLTEEHHSNLSLMEKAEKEQIETLLVQRKWNISAVSKELKIARSTLYRKLKKYNLKVL